MARRPAVHVEGREVHLRHACARRRTPPAKLRLNPRKDWYANVEAIEAPDPYTVVFRLKRPQPSLLLMLASGYSPVYAAHVPPAAVPHDVHRHRARSSSRSGARASSSST